MGFGSRCPAILGGTLCLLARCNRCNRCHVKSKRRFDARFSRSIWMSWTAATSTGHSRKLVSLWCCSLWWPGNQKCGVSFMSFLEMTWGFCWYWVSKSVGIFFCWDLLLNLDCLAGFHVLWNVCFGYGRSVFLCLPLCSGFGSQPGNTLSFQVISTGWSDFQSKKWLEEHAVPEKVPSPHKRHNPTLFGAKSLSQLPVPINKRSLQERYKSMGMKVLSFGLRYCCLYTSYSQYLRRWAVSSYNDLALHPFVAWLHWWKTETFWGIGWRFCSEVSNHHSKVGKHVLLEGSTILAAGHWAGASLQKHARQNPNM